MFRVFFGQPCPACGTTTAWVYLMRGQLPEALQSNVGGAMEGMLSLIVVPWLLLSAYRGRWFGWSPKLPAYVMAGNVVVMLAVWSFRLWGK